MASLKDIGAYNAQYLSGAPDAEDESFLAELRRYDPNARFTDVTHANSEWGDDAKFKLEYDPTLLPKIGGREYDPGRQMLMDSAFRDRTPGIGAQGGAHGFKGELYRPDMVAKDATYGSWTIPQNVKDPATALDKFGPMVPMLFAAAAPAIFGGLSGGALGGGFSFGGLSNTGSRIAQGIVNGARSLDSGGGFGSLLPGLAGFTGIPGASVGASMLANIIRQRGRAGG